jgi:RNA polymerase sigma-70 factor (ECF subfamily)
MGAATEVELMGRYCDGDGAAFHALYARVAPRLLGYLVSLIGDRATAEDLLQHTFLKVHQSRSAYVRGAAPLPWLYTIAHRTCLDEMRRRKHARVKLARGSDTIPEPRADLDGMAEGARNQSRYEPTLASAAMAALEQLPPSQREALVLTKVHGHSVAEAAAIMGTTKGAIKLRAHRAYIALRKLLDAQGEGA